ncbi:MAG: M23 family metallopeptidase [Oligoflexales bacterium]
MFRLYILFLFSVFSISASKEDDIYTKTNQFEHDVRERKYSKYEGEKILKQLLDEVSKNYKLRECTTTLPKKWVFPVAWHKNTDIGGKHGNGYRPQGFNYFDGIKTKGHSAHDIFIHDRNVDLHDDRYHKMVPALAVEPGIILSTQEKWSPQSHLKAGRYVNIYHPHNQQVSYYSHLASIHIKPGDCVNAGDSIGWIGRSGLNADSKRSPTHLHFGRLLFNGTTYIPTNPYKKLIKATKIFYKSH